MKVLDVVHHFLIAFVLAACAHEASLPPAGQNPSPMLDHTRSHQRLSDAPLFGTTLWIDDVLPKPVSLFIPESVETADSLDILIHFHGAAFIANRAALDVGPPMVAVNVHLGAGSSVYERPFLDASTFATLLRQVEDSIETRGLPPPRRRNLYLSGFSAGYGAIRAILKNHAEDIEAVLLLEGLHTDYVPDGLVLAEGGSLNTQKLEVFVTFASRAVAGEKRLLITHSEIFPGTFPSTTETTDYIISSLGLERAPVLEWGPGGMQMISRTEAGRLTILGFAGNTAPDHVDHFHGLPEFLRLLVGS